MFTDSLELVNFQTKPFGNYRYRRGGGLFVMATISDRRKVKLLLKGKQKAKFLYGCQN